MGGFCWVFPYLLFEHSGFVMPFFIFHEAFFSLQIPATVCKKCVFFLRKAQDWWLMPKTSLKTSLKSPLCSCEHCSVNKCGRDQLPQCQTHSSVCFTSPTLCPHTETFLENFVADFTAAPPKMILLCLVTWLPLILCYVGNFCRLWMCYYLEDNNLFIISFG